jgi:hypothetical protein
MGPQFTAERNAGGSGGVGAATPASSTSDGGGSGGEDGGGGSGGKGGDEAAACFGSPRWVKSYGDALDQVGMSVVADAAGDVAIAGVFQGTIDFGGGPLTAVPNAYSLYVAKLDADGDALWSHAYQGGIDYVAGEGIPFATVAVTPEGGVILGGEFSGTVDFGVGAPTVATSTIGDGFVLAFDSAGAPLWSVHYGDATPDPQHPQTVLPQTVESVDVDAQGNVLVLGYRGWGTGGGMFLVKLDSTGNELWKKSVSTSGTLESTVRADASGNVVVAGLAFAALDLGGTPLPVSTAFPTFYWAKFDPSGNPLWSHGAVTMGLGLHPGNGLGVDALGNVFVAGGGGDLNLDVGCGLFPTAWTTKVMEFDAASGDCLWNAGFSDFGSAIGVDLSGRPIVATDVVDQIDTYPKAGGVPGPACVDTLTPSGSIALYGFATAPSGHALMTGAFSGTAALEGDASSSSTFTSAGHRDVFLASF